MLANYAMDRTNTKEKLAAAPLLKLKHSQTMQIQQKKSLIVGEIHGFGSSLLPCAG